MITLISNNLYVLWVQALNTYTGGRQKGLSDLSAGTFDSSKMTPTFYNLDYTGPAGKHTKNKLFFKVEWKGGTLHTRNIGS